MKEDPGRHSMKDVRAIVIGGSAGGIEALRTLLPALPKTLPVPVVIVLHLSPQTKGAWSSVFPTCPLPVQEAEDKEQALPGRVYIAPADYHLLVDETGLLSLSLDEQVNLARPSIDVLFESAAWAYGSGVLGIVLSGANSDGAKGLSSIHRSGGKCWVQSPETAAAVSMPRAAIRAVPDARVLDLGRMSETFRAW